MSNFESKILAQGQLPVAKGTLFTAPNATRVYVKFMNIFNTNAAQQAIFIYAKTLGGTSRIICRATLDQNEQERVLEKEETLNMGPGDEIEGQTTTASAVDYTISGVQETNF